MQTVIVAERHVESSFETTTSSSRQRAAAVPCWCRRPSLDLSMTVNTVMTPSMTSSNSMSSGYCSLDDESEDFSFFTAKTSFFRKPKSAPKVQNRGSTPTLSLTDEILRVRQRRWVREWVVQLSWETNCHLYQKHAPKKQKRGEEVVVFFVYA